MIHKSQTTSPQQSYLRKTEGGLASRLLWLWTGTRLTVQRGTHHGEGVEWPQPDVEQCYRGWYDPKGKEMFVVRPRKDANEPDSLRPVPSALDRALQRRFGDEFRYLLC